MPKQLEPFSLPRSSQEKPRLHQVLPRIPRTTG
jgi:hypothetical protein